MRFEFTLRTPDGEHDVGVDVSGAVRLRDLHTRLLAVIGAPAGARLRGAPLTAELGSREFGAGAVLTVETGGAQAEQTDRSADTRTRPHPLALQVVGGKEAGSTLPLRPGRVVIGRGRYCGVVLVDDAASREHAVLDVQATGTTIADCGSTNGTFVEGEQVGPAGTTLAADAVVRIGDTLLTVRGDRHAAVPVVRTGDHVAISPPPRASEPPERAVVETTPPPRRDAAHRVQWAAALIPVAAAGALAWFLHSATFLLFAALSPLMLLATALGDRLHGRRSARRGATALRAQMAGDDRAVLTALRDETQRARAASPDAPALAAAALGPTARLWERRSGDSDVLCVRLGSAALPSRTLVRCDGDTRPAGLLRDVPLTLDLRDGPLGLVGPPADVLALARWLVVQLAVLHPPSVVRLALLVADPGVTDPDLAARWAWLRWLPHLVVRTAEDAGRSRLSAAGSGHDTVARAALHAPERRPWTVVVVDASAAGGGDDRPAPGAALADPGPPAVSRTTAIVLADSAARLPGWCVRTLDLTRPDDAVSWVTGPHAPGAHPDGAGGVVVDGVRADWAEHVARALAPFVEASSGTGPDLPDTCRLLDLLGLDDLTCDAVLARWSADDGRPSTVLGVGADGPVAVDLTRDGPHVLVAGTTGSGKSELLRSLVLGLALNHPPDAIAFVLVDFKGGAAFADCSALPHVAGMVTDLDPQLTQRALHSLNAELRRRERLFADVGAADLDAYRAHHPAVPVPRLVLVVDEFAALVDELPDFLHGVVSVAQRGRSLGVHLVLATQRPGSAVTPEIRANTALRVALRVFDPGESHEIVGVPDAAAVPGDRPGRAVLRAGGHPVALQTACVGSPTRPAADDVSVELLGPWRRSVRGPRPESSTGCGPLVEIVAEAAARAGVVAAASPWLPPLPRLVGSASLAMSGDTIAVGLVDRPAQQRRDTLALDLGTPSAWLFVGAARSGRTTALLTAAVGAAAVLAPDRLELYVLDATGELSAGLRGLPHVATCLGPDELSEAPALVRRLVARPPQAGRAMLLVDGGERLLVPDDAPSGLTIHDLDALRRSGVSVLVAGSRALLVPRVAGAFVQRFVLRLSERSDYAQAGIAVGDVPSTMPPGRALRAVDGAEVQLAFPGDAPGPSAAAAAAGNRDGNGDGADHVVSEAVDAAVAELSRRWAGHRSTTAVRLRPLPRQVRLADLPADPTRLRLGLAGEQAAVLSIAPDAGARHWLVAGPAGSGRTTTLTTLLLEAHRTGTPVLVAAPRRSALFGHARRLGITALSPDADDDLECPRIATLVLVDDVDAFDGTPTGDRLAAWAEDDTAPVSLVLGGRAEDLAAAYTGPAVAVRRHRCGLLLRPGPLDGDLFGVRLPRRDDLAPGRGYLVGQPFGDGVDGSGWSNGWSDGSAGAPLPVQVAQPMCG